jgi:hypothetical protein
MANSFIIFSVKNTLECIVHSCTTMRDINIIDYSSSHSFPS